MSSKSGKEKDGGKKQNMQPSKKQASPKTKKNFEEEEAYDEEEDITDEWENPTADEFDSDLEEFEPPRSPKKRNKGKKQGGPEDDFGLEDDYDMGYFNDPLYDDEDDDDDLY